MRHFAYRGNHYIQGLNQSQPRPASKVEFLNDESVKFNLSFRDGSKQQKCV